jgi:hypothetical protein
LRAYEYLARVNLLVLAEAAVNVGHGLNEEFQPGQDSQLRDLIDADTCIEFWRSGAPKEPVSI